MEVAQFMESPDSKLAPVRVQRRAWLLFGLVFLVGAVAGTVWHAFSSRQYATFELRSADPVSGLIADSPVEFHGVEVGKVQRVQLLDPRSVRILLNVSRHAPITRATVATITTRGLASRGYTGYAYVSLEDAGADHRPLSVLPGEIHPLIPTAPARSVTLDTTIGEVKQDVRQLTDALHSVLDPETVASLKRSISDLKTVADVLATNSQRLDAMISSAERTTKYAERLGRDVKPLLDSSQEVVKALQNQILPQTDDAIVRVGELSALLKEISAEIERNPAVLVRGKSPPTPGPGETK
jgi:phospholipid/cholesterol/gamma-HCH transport system substrate-binding protein